MAERAITRSTDLRAGNRLRILKTLRRLGPSTHEAIVESTQLSAAAVSTQITALATQGVVMASRKKSTTQSSRGRPRSVAALDPSAANVITLSITDDQFDFHRADYLGGTISSHTERVLTGSLDLQALLLTIQRGIRTLCPEGVAQIHEVGISVQGVVEQNSGRLLWSPILELEQVELKQQVEDCIGLPVSVDNDCTLIAAALHSDQKRTYGDTFAAILFSYGVGLGMYHQGSALLGRQSSALELGHIQFRSGGANCRCGKLGCIEAYAADYAIERRRWLGTPDQPPVERSSIEPLAQAVIAARNHDADAMAAFADAGRAVGFGIGQLFTLFDPMPVVLVGRHQDAYGLMRPGLIEALSECHRDGEQNMHWIHHEPCAHTLLHQGLAMETLARIDQQLATGGSQSQSRTHAASNHAAN